MSNYYTGARKFRGGKFFKKFHIENNFLSKEECESIIEYYNTKDKEEPEIGRKNKDTGTTEFIVNEEIRKGQLVFLGYNDGKFLEIFEKLYYSATFANFGWGILPLNYVQLTKYDSNSDGGYYKRHKDVVPGIVPQRIISVVIQLSPRDSYTDCNLIFHDNINMPHISKYSEQGDAIFFLSDIPHEVTPITSGVRYSLVGWFEGPLCWS